jgi:hypothetical protein
MPGFRISGWRVKCSKGVFPLQIDSGFEDWEGFPYYKQSLYSVSWLDRPNRSQEEISKMKLLSLAVASLFLFFTGQEKAVKPERILRPRAVGVQEALPPTVIGTGSDQTLLLDEFGDLTVTWFGQPLNSTDNAILISRSQNHGASWSAPLTLPVEGMVSSDAPIGATIAVERNGTIDAVTVCLPHPTCPGNPIDLSVQLIRSTDGGKTWSPSQDISLPPSGGGSGAGEPTIAACGAGIVVVWTDDGRGSDGSNSDGLTNDIILRNISGGVLGPAINLSNTQNASKGHPQIAVSPQSNVFVTWVTDNGLGDSITTDSIVFAEVPNCGEVK